MFFFDPLNKMLCCKNVRTIHHISTYQYLDKCAGSFQEDGKDQHRTKNSGLGGVRTIATPTQTNRNGEQNVLHV